MANGFCTGSLAMIYITVVSRLPYAVPCGLVEGVGPSTSRGTVI